MVPAVTFPLASPFDDTPDTPTVAAFADPQPGDRFHEMLSFWMFVVAVQPGNGRVAVLTLAAPGTMPRDGKLKVYPTHDAYREAWAYSTIPGYTVSLAARGTNVTGWFPGWDHIPQPPAPPTHEMKTLDRTVHTGGKVTVKLACPIEGCCKATLTGGASIVDGVVAYLATAPHPER